ncbi:N-acetyltransferase [Brevundimonas vesicularis]|uniref:N-acetyltransferase n=1 Tax=Brevundimonas vesicularis TaxID=41276 RepID=UPI0038D3DE52
MTPDDVPGVNRLHRNVWWPERSVEGWEWLARNPATVESKSPIGLILDDDQGQPAAFLGCFAQRFVEGDRVFYGATGFSFIVPRDVRGGTRHLIPAFLAQSQFVLHYTLNANALSSPIYKRFGLMAWPNETHDLKLSWITNPVVCGTARGLRQLVKFKPAAVNWLGESLMPWSSSLSPSRLGDGIVLVEDRSARSAYDRFWQNLRAEGRFMADRSPQMMEWRLADPDQPRPLIHLARVQDGEVTGHALAMMAKYSSIEPPSLEIIDLAALAGHGSAVRDLAGALIRLAGPLGAAKVRLQVLGPQLLTDLGDLAGQARREGGYGHCHVGLVPGFEGHQSWQPTPFDGDFSICLRPLPRRGIRAGSLPSQAA